MLTDPRFGFDSLGAVRTVLGGLIPSAQDADGTLAKSVSEDQDSRTGESKEPSGKYETRQRGIFAPGDGG